MPYIDEVRDELMDQHYLTQRALERLGIHDLNQPVTQLPLINTILPTEDPPSYSPDEMLHLIQIAGTPHAGKTTTGMKLSASINPSLYCQETYPEARQRAESSADVERITRIIKTGFDLEVLKAMDLMNDGVITRMPIFQERGYIDEVTLKRMLFLQGKTRFPAEDLDLFEQTKFFTQDKVFCLTCILCLIPPNISRERGSKKNFLTRFMNNILDFITR